jgi:hypothetical protein
MLLGRNVLNLDHKIIHGSELPLYQVTISSPIFEVILKTWLCFKRDKLISVGRGDDRTK